MTMATKTGFSRFALLLTVLVTTAAGVGGSAWLLARAIRWAGDRWHVGTIENATWKSIGEASTLLAMAIFYALTMAALRMRRRRGKGIAAAGNH